MQKKMLIALLVLAIIGGAVFFLTRGSSLMYQQNESNMTPVTVDDIDQNIVWNAYTLNDHVFIYPADWTFEEVKDPQNPKKSIGFKTTYPVSSNSMDVIEGGGLCPEITIPEIHTACIQGMWLHTQSESKVVLHVFDNMKKFGEKEI